jgi:hypothetical protein
MMSSHLIKLIAMDQQQLLSIGRDMQPFEGDQYVPE